jgi:hypothetical protein
VLEAIESSSLRPIDSLGLRYRGPLQVGTVYFMSTCKRVVRSYSIVMPTRTINRPAARKSDPYQTARTIIRIIRHINTITFALAAIATVLALISMVSVIGFYFLLLIPLYVASLATVFGLIYGILTAILALFDLASDTATLRRLAVLARAEQLDVTK